MPTRHQLFRKAVTTIKPQLGFIKKTPPNPNHRGLDFGGAFTFKNECRLIPQSYECISGASMFELIRLPIYIFVSNSKEEWKFVKTPR